MSTSAAPRFSSVTPAPGVVYVAHPAVHSAKAARISIRSRAMGCSSGFAFLGHGGVRGFFLRHGRAIDVVPRAHDAAVHDRRGGAARHRNEGDAQGGDSPKRWLL